MAALLGFLAACGTEEPQLQPRAAAARGPIAEPVAVTYDGGIYVLDGGTLDVEADVKLSGFNRLNPAGDDRHLMVSTSDGFRALDAVDVELTDITFPGAEPGHVVRHAGRTVLFTDGTGEVRIVDPTTLDSGHPEVETYRAARPHHGVAIELANDELVVTLGDADERVGIVVLDENRKEIARHEDCPGVHGEATAKDETVVPGCESGVRTYRDGQIAKGAQPHRVRPDRQPGRQRHLTDRARRLQAGQGRRARATGAGLADRHRRRHAEAGRHRHQLHVPFAGPRACR
jgi:hypothetical protein